MKWLTLFLLPFTLFACEPFFTLIDPPKGWLFSNPSTYEKGVKVGFIASSRKIFTPSLTLTIEKVGEASMDTYVKAIEKLYRSDHFQKLGTFKTESGTARLFQIDQKNQWGEIRILQAIVLHEGYALIQTGVCLKKDFLDMHETFLNAFKTLRTTPTLYASCQDPSLKEKVEGVTKCWKKLCATSKDDNETLFNSSFFQKNQWKPFVSYIEKELHSEGLCWQFLALKYIQETLLTENGT